MIKPKYTLDYGLIKEQMDRFLQSVPNKLEREWHAPHERRFPRAVGNSDNCRQHLSHDRIPLYRQTPRLAPEARNVADSSTARTDDNRRALYVHLLV